MPVIPPGIQWIIQRLPKLLTPPILVSATHYILTHFLDLDLDVPAWLYATALFLSLPAAFLVSASAERLRQKRECYRLGAVMPKSVESKWPGGLDTLGKMLANFKTGYPGDMFEEWTRKYGNTYNVRVLFEDRIFTVEPEHIKAILATEFNSFEKGEKFKFQAQSVLGTGVFNSDGDMWKFHRSMTRPFFSKDRISHFDIFDRHADDAIRRMKERARDGTPIDFQDVVSRFTLDSATEFLFGDCVHSLSAGLPYSPNFPAPPNANNERHPANVFAKAFAESQDMIALRSRFGTAWPLAEFWRDKTEAPMEIINSFIDPIVAAAIERKRAAAAGASGEKKRDEVEDDETLLDHLVNYTEDPAILKDETINIMIAGRDTTAATLTFLIYALSLHPQVLERLRAEILTKVGSSRRPTYDDLRDMKYLRAVINETLRLFPPVPFNMRQTTQATTLVNKADPSKPFYVPAGTKCPYSVFLMQRRTDLWGPDALEFDPDRFLDERVHKYLTPNPFIFLPFNAGPRICLGQQFAYNEAAFMMVRLLQNFDRFALAPDAQPQGSLPPKAWAKAQGRKATEKFWPRSHLTMYAHGGLWVRLGEAPPSESV